jgi:hypothetical protein
MVDTDDDDFASAVDRSAALRAAFAAAVAAVLDEEPADKTGPSPSTGFAAQLTEVAWQWTTTSLAPDLEAFARHAKRAKVGMDDVVLAARRNEVTHELLERTAAQSRGGGKA